MTTIANTARALALLLDTRERVALAALAEIGAALLDPKSIGLDLPPVTRACVSFDACAGLGQISDTMLFDAGDNPVPDDAARAILSAVFTSGPGAGMPVGKLLSGTVLSLLELRHSDWTEEEGATGTAEIRWQRKDDGTVEPLISGIISYRYLATNDYSFWNENGVTNSVEQREEG